MPQSQIRTVSPWYETAPIGNTTQANFTNAALALDTSLNAITLLRALLSIENQQGRVRKERWGPRSIDLDLLLYGDEQWRTNELWLPHPRISERRFVLQPLHDIQPTLMLNGKPISGYLARCAEQTITQIEPLTTREQHHAG